MDPTMTTRTNIWHALDLFNNDYSNKSQTKTLKAMCTDMFLGNCTLSHLLEKAVPQFAKGTSQRGFLDKLCLSGHNASKKSQLKLQFLFDNIMCKNSIFHTCIILYLVNF